MKRNFVQSSLAGPLPPPVNEERSCNACGVNPSGVVELEACCGQLGPYEVTLNVPLYGLLGSGRRKRLLPVLD